MTDVADPTTTRRHHDDELAEARVRVSASVTLAAYIAGGDPDPAELGTAIVALLTGVDWRLDRLGPLEERRAPLRAVS